MSTNYNGTTNINFNNDISKVTKLVSIAEDFEGDMDLISGSRTYDCRSFMALINLDLSKNYIVGFITTDVNKATETTMVINEEINGR